MTLLCRIGLHRCDVVRDTGCHEYRVCRHCGKREINTGSRGHQPIDRGWLETGEWTKMVPPPKTYRPLPEDDDLANFPVDHNGDIFVRRPKDRVR